MLASHTQAAHYLPGASRRRGFTLIELLVVISIIALLIALLLPALGAARAVTRQLVCATNLHSLSQAAVTYANEHNGQLPRDYWPGQHLWEGNPHVLLPEAVNEELGGRYPVIPPNLDSGKGDRDKYLAAVFSEMEVLQCPTFPPTTRSPVTVTHPWTNAQVEIAEQPYDYVTNAFKLGADTGSSEVTKLGQISIPSAIIFATEASADLPLHQFGKHDVFNDGHLWDRPNPRMIRDDDQRHDGRLNVGFFDGHGETLEFDELDRGMFDPDLSP